MPRQEATVGLLVPLLIVAAVAAIVWGVYRALGKRPPEAPDPDAGDTRKRQI
jgi:hypothetical protein